MLDLLKKILSLSWLDGWKTYLAAVSGLMFGIQQLLSGNIEAGWAAITAALAVFGIRQAQAKIEAQQKSVESKVDSWT